MDGHTGHLSNTHSQEKPLWSSTILAENEGKEENKPVAIWEQSIPEAKAGSRNKPRVCAEQQHGQRGWKMSAEGEGEGRKSPCKYVGFRSE